MAKISDETRARYLGRIQQYQSNIAAILQAEKAALELIQQGGENPGLKRLALAEDMLNLCSNYIVINGVSQSLMETKNEDALNEGRKALYKGILYMEEVVSNYIDVPFSDYEKKLEPIASLSAAERYRLVRKMGFSIELLENAYGDNTKWKWSFVELEGRYAAVAKNIFDLKNALANTDPGSPNYEPTVYHLRLVKKILGVAADRYRQKYELSTNRPDDFEQGIRFLGALRRIHINIGEQNEAEELKKRIDAWTAKLKTDSKRKAEIPPKKA
ncbi:hypothetical protein FACS189493_4620 [Spirochaetia bacterium]|nr:hypothetical protein FACS189493_4620 [Spirochaetia bacterium]